MSDAIVSLEPCGASTAPDLAYATRRAVDRLGTLTTHIDGLAGKFPLREHAGLRSQMRRAAMDALTSAACALEAVSAHDYRELMLRAIGALGELDTFARLGEKAGAVTPTEGAHVSLLAQLADHELRLSLDEFPSSLLGAA